MTPTPDLTPLLPDDGEIAARRAALLAELRVDPSPVGASARSGAGGQRRRRAPRNLALGLAALLVVGGGVAGASALFGARDVAVDAGIGCYDRAADPTNVAALPAVADPVGACAKLWREGSMDGTVRAVAPPLVACSAPGRPALVFPGADPKRVCEEAGLAPLPADYAAEGKAAARAQDALAAIGRVAVARTACPSPAARAATVRRRLAAAGHDVAVVVAGDGPCAARVRVVHGRLAVDTVSRETAARNRLAARIDHALAPFYRGPMGACRAPDGVAAEMRRLLDAEGLRDVRVDVEGDGPCTNNGIGVDAETRTVSISTRPPASSDD